MNFFILLFFIYFICIYPLKKTDFYCIDDNNGKDCKNHDSSKYQYISSRHLAKSAFNKINNIFIYIYTDIALNDNFLNNFKSKLTIFGNGKSKVSLNTNEFSNLSLFFNNVEVSTNSNAIQSKSIELVHTTFTNKLSVISYSFISDSFSLESFSSVSTEKIILTQDQKMSKKTDIFIIKGSNYHLFTQENPQVTIYNNIDSEMIFGSNYLELANFKIISQIYPFIEIENVAPKFDVKSRMNLTQNVLLTPIINMLSGNCTFYGSNWPQLPRKINSYWESDIFYDTNERKILVVLENSSSISLSGNKIPISIKSNGYLSIYCETADCGITGQIYTQTSNDNLFTSIEEKVTFYVSEIINMTTFSYLKSKSSNIQVIIETCRNSYIFNGLSNYTCNSIDNNLEQITSMTNLAPNGNITFYMKLNTDTVVNRLKSIINYRSPGNIYDDQGSVNITYIFNYIMSLIPTDNSASMSIISALKSFGSNLVGIDFVRTSGTHTLTIKRSDILYSLLYFNVYKYNKYLVCSTNPFKMSNWRVQLDDFNPDQINLPFFDFNETNFSFTTRNYENNETTYCLQMRINQYPNSAVEFLVHTIDSNLEGNFAWLSGVFATFVSARKLSNIKSMLSNPNAKNVVFVTLNDLGSALDLYSIRTDSNVLIIGATLKLVDELKNGISNINFDIVRPNIIDSWQQLNSIGYILCKVNTKKINVKNFLAVAVDIVNKDEFVINAEDVVLDISTWLQLLSNGHEYKFRNFVLLPFEIKPSIRYCTLKKVEFLNDRWKIQFENLTCEINYTTVSGRFLIMTGANKTLNLALDKSFFVKDDKTVLRPLEIGYNVAFEKNLSSFPGIPLLSDEDSSFSGQQNGFRLDFFKMLKSAILKNAEKSDNGLENIIFEGDWNRISDFSGKMIYSSGKRELKVTNFPAKHSNKIEFSSKERIVIDSIAQDEAKSRVSIKQLNPLVINGRRELTVPSTTDVEFDNITVFTKGSSFKLLHKERSSSNLVKTRVFKAASGSSCFFNQISVSESVKLEPNSYTIFEKPTFSENTKIEYYFTFEKRFPQLVIKNKDALINNVVLHYAPEGDSPNIAEDYPILPQIILKKSTETNECEKMKSIFTFQNPNEKISLFCEFTQGDKMSFTSFGLNITVKVDEGEIDEGEDENTNSKDKSKKKMVIILVSAIGGALAIALLITVVVFCIKKRKKSRRRDGSSEPLTSDQSQAFNNENSF